MLHRMVRTLTRKRMIGFGNGAVDPINYHPSRLLLRYFQTFFFSWFLFNSAFFHILQKGLEFRTSTAQCPRILDATGSCWQEFIIFSWSFVLVAADQRVVPANWRRFWVSISTQKISLPKCFPIIIIFPFFSHNAEYG